MNFYQHHIGDFNNSTRHLTRIERSIYRDLLDIYYDTESPLTSDFDRLARRCIVDDSERAAMRDVLNEFFTLKDNGYHNTRADKEIAAYKRMAEGGKRGAEKRWGKANDSHPIATPLPPHDKANANHEPLTNNQEPIVNTLVISHANDKPDCPHQDIISVYHEVLPQCPKVRDWTQSRQTQLRTRWNESADRQNLDYWRRLFEYVGECDFLTGRTPKPFFADLEWITKTANFTKIRERKYENRVAA